MQPESRTSESGGLEEKVKGCAEKAQRQLFFLGNKMQPPIKDKLTRNNYHADYTSSPMVFTASSWNFQVQKTYNLWNSFENASVNNAYLPTIIHQMILSF